MGGSTCRSTMCSGQGDNKRQNQTRHLCQRRNGYEQRQHLSRHHAHGRTRAVSGGTCTALRAREKHEDGRQRLTEHCALGRKATRNGGAYHGPMRAEDWGR